LMSRLIGNCRPGLPGRADEVAAVAGILTVPGVPAGRLWGAGVDLVDQQRFALAVRRTGPALLRHVFDGSEWTAPPERSEAVPDEAELAGLGRRFGIKESVVKVAGGLPAGGRYRDILVGGAGVQGVRTIDLHGALARWAESEHLSLVGGVLDGDLPSAGPDLCWAVAVREQSTAARTDQRGA
jgi:phosphopantetheinyl transferase (holo-ACP synthase)